jgi:hypothetical protein
MVGNGGQEPAARNMDHRETDGPLITQPKVDSSVSLSASHHQSGAARPRRPLAPPSYEGSAPRVRRAVRSLIAQGQLLD